MSGAVDVLMVLAGFALTAVVMFRLGIWWTNWRSRRSWTRRYAEGLVPVGARPRLPNCSSPVADGVPGDNPVGVSIPPTNVPPAGARTGVRLDGEAIAAAQQQFIAACEAGELRHRRTVAAEDRLRVAQDFFPQAQGR